MDPEHQGQGEHSLEKLSLSHCLQLLPFSLEFASLSRFAPNVLLKKVPNGLHVAKFSSLGPTFFPPAGARGLADRSLALERSFFLPSGESAAAASWSALQGPSHPRH